MLKYTGLNWSPVTGLEEKLCLGRSVAGDFSLELWFLVVIFWGALCRYHPLGADGHYDPWATSRLCRKASIGGLPVYLASCLWPPSPLYLISDKDRFNNHRRNFKGPGQSTQFTNPFSISMEPIILECLIYLLFGKKSLPVFIFPIHSFMKATFDIE